MSGWIPSMSDDMASTITGNVHLPCNRQVCQTCVLHFHLHKHFNHLVCYFRALGASKIFTPTGS